jgi:hypothetical protein
VEGKGRRAATGPGQSQKLPKQPLPGQVGLFEYRPHAVEHGHGELFDTGRDLPGAEEDEQRILWEVES